LIRDIETITASLHDSQVDLSFEGEAVLRDKGYFGVQPKGDDFTMKRATAGHPLNDIDKLRNGLISKLRSPGERPYSVMKRVFRAGQKEGDLGPHSLIFMPSQYALSPPYYS
jgi:IS5 family transposase